MQQQQETTTTQKAFHSSHMKRVAVIGGGAAGLCAAKQLLSHKGILPVVYEQSTSVGGTWVYEDVEKGVEPFSSIYKSLR